ncbi:hypothetical protein JJE62_10145 [Alloprevotella tannerae]|uniref:hypothetical protein n=1 Tax=Alloprevotella tannerae TaxID=76122 RepID=UPI001ED9E92E|nr:hypothetical protein [Alloprevotella tannerae]MCG2647791.1 hypothetical protein [Alloprevotella tannerae]
MKLRNQSCQLILGHYTQCIYTANRRQQPNEINEVPHQVKPPLNQMKDVVSHDCYDTAVRSLGRVGLADEEEVLSAIATSSSWDLRAVA